MQESVIKYKHSRCHYIGNSTDTKDRTHTGKRYRYRGSVRIQENDIDIGDQYEYRKMIQLEKQYKYRFQTFTTIKESVIVELTNRQAGMQASVHPSKTKQAGVLTYNTRGHHIRCGNRSRHR